MLLRCRLCRNYFWTESLDWKDDQETATGKPSLCGDCDFTNQGTKPTKKSLPRVNMKAYERHTRAETKVLKEESKARIKRLEAEAELMKARAERVRRSFL